MKYLNKIKNKKIIAVVLVGLLIITSLLLMDFTKSTPLENDVEVEENSELIYYLDVSYEGVDRYGSDSSIIKNTDTIINTESGYILVEDKLPEGLTFNEFITAEDGTVGAVHKLDSSKACLGQVYDDTAEGEESNTNYHGLHYNEETRTVSFRVRYLQAGCKLTLGIKTTTPTLAAGEIRKDFYNTATASEGPQLVNSNTVHAWMGKQTTLYNVTYKYDENFSTPSNAPDPSVYNGSYAENTTIGIASKPNLEGYTFSGWTIVQIEGETPIIQTNSNFVMPNRDVELIGHFEKIEPYKVTYKLADGSPIPDGYEVPPEKSYYPNTMVQVDGMKADDKFNGYKFSGWSIESPEGLEINKNNELAMPEENVVLVGSFEKIKYKVEYKFTGDVLPYNADQYLPETEYHEPGEIIELKDVNYTGSSYKFLGWYKENKFTMPESDVIIYGEWKEFYGYFEPVITKEIYEKKDYYKKGDIVKYKITVQNNENFAIKNVQVKEYNQNAKFLEGYNYEIRTKNLVSIPHISSNSSVAIDAEYIITNETGTVDNTVQIIGALADSWRDYELDPTKEYKASEEFKIYSELKIRKNVLTNEDEGKVFQFHITSEKGYDTWLNLTGNNEKTLYIAPDDTYTIMEIVPQEYILKSVSGAINDNNKSFNVEFGKNYSVEFTNQYKKKGFYHSYGRAKNEIQDCSGDCETLYQIVENDENAKTTTMDGTGSTAKVYYYDNNENNNVKFANLCWRIIRTTDTDGVKLMYNGEPNANGTCTNSGYLNSSTNGTLNDKNDSLAYKGYMYNENNVYELEGDYYNHRESINVYNSIGYAVDDDNRNRSEYNYVIGTEYHYDESIKKYVIENPEEYNLVDSWTSIIGKYICFTNSYTCDELNYVIEKDAGHSSGISYGGVDFITLKNGEKIDDKVIILATGFEQNGNKYILKDITSIKMRDWYTNYSDYIGLYTCSDFTSTSCGILYNITSADSTYFYSETKYNFTFGQSAIWNGNQYELINTTNISDFENDANKIGNYHYTCLTDNSTCDSVYYVYKAYGSSSSLSINYIELTDGNDVNMALNNMLGSNNDSDISNIKLINGNKNSNYIHSNDSTVKSFIDSFYRTKLYQYHNYMEDTIYCNDRSILSYGGWEPNSGDITNGIVFAPKDSLVCNRKIDSFTTSIENGNGDLTYPIGLIDEKEAKLIGYDNLEIIKVPEKSKTIYNVRVHMSSSDNFSFSYFENLNGASECMSGNECEVIQKINPVISLNSNTVACMGDGTPDNPYVINMNKVEVGVE